MKYRIRRAFSCDEDGTRQWQVNYGRRAFRSRVPNEIPRDEVERWLLEEAPAIFGEQVNELRRRAVDDEHAQECLNWYEAGLHEGRGGKV